VRITIDIKYKFKMYFFHWIGTDYTDVIKKTTESFSVMLSMMHVKLKFWFIKHNTSLHFKH